jgi:branched-chain amino acid transport system substrate-binding protein
VGAKRRALVAVVGLLLAPTGCGSRGVDTDADASDTVVLGASLVLTGQLAREGLLTKTGYDVCARVVNDRGGIPVGGRKLKIAIRYQDDTSKPDIAAQLIDQFNDQRIKFILGPYGSALNAAAAPVVERNGQVMLDSAGADDQIFQKGYRRTFAVQTPASHYAASIIKAAHELAQPAPRRVAILSADDGFSKSAAEGAVRTANALGLHVIGPEYFPDGATDVSSSLTKIKGARPDVIIGSVHLAEGIAIIKQAAELGIRPTGGFGETVAPPTPDFPKALGHLAEGVLGSSQWTPEVAGHDPWFGTAKDYVQTYGGMFDGEVPQYHAAEATAACLALVVGIEKAGSTDPDRVRDAVAGLKMESFFGVIDFNDKGQNDAKPMLVIQIQQGKPVTVWPKESASGALVWPAA